MAIAVAQQVLDGQTLILDGGTTGMAVAEELVGRNITVCALNLRVAEVLAADSATRVLTPGGLVRAGEASFVGSQAEAALAAYRFDLFVMTASAVAASVGFTEWNIDDAAVKRAGLANSRRTVVAVDGSKFGQEAFARICGLDDVALIVTDESVDARRRDEFTVAGAELLIA
ncbi:DeoR/GlpR family DNA-binding transcription regulator [Tsukamurella soli]|uniref:DeoR/GlpR family DNA-binding transcription regulator n=1 Tax=Tsukamurella soli TaxID=644556 RepID=UPI0036160879